MSTPLQMYLLGICIVGLIIFITPTSERVSMGQDLFVSAIVGLVWPLMLLAMIVYRLRMESDRE